MHLTAFCYVCQLLLVSWINNSGPQVVHHCSMPIATLNIMWGIKKTFKNTAHTFKSKMTVTKMLQQWTQAGGPSPTWDFCIYFSYHPCIKIANTTIMLLFLIFLKEHNLLTVGCISKTYHHTKLHTLQSIALGLHPPLEVYTLAILVLTYPRQGCIQWYDIHTKSHRNQSTILMFAADCGDGHMHSIKWSPSKEGQTCLGTTTNLISCSSFSTYLPNNRIQTMSMIWPWAISIQSPSSQPSSPRFILIPSVSYFIHEVTVFPHQNSVFSCYFLDLRHMSSPSSILYHFIYLYVQIVKLMNI